MILITQDEIAWWTKKKIFTALSNFSFKELKNFFPMLLQVRRKKKCVSCYTSLKSWCGTTFLFSFLMFFRVFFLFHVCSSLFRPKSNGNTVKDQKLKCYKLFFWKIPEKFQVKGVRDGSKKMFQAYWLRKLRSYFQIKCWFFGRCLSFHDSITRGITRKLWSVTVKEFLDSSLIITNQNHLYPHFETVAI